MPLVEYKLPSQLYNSNLLETAFNHLHEGAHMRLLGIASSKDLYLNAIHLIMMAFSVCRMMSDEWTLFLLVPRHSGMVEEALNIWCWLQHAWSDFVACIAIAWDSIQEHAFLGINKEVLVPLYFLVGESFLGNSPNTIISLQGTVIDWEVTLKYLVDFENFMGLLNFLSRTCLLSGCITLFKSLLWWKGWSGIYRCSVTLYRSNLTLILIHSLVVLAKPPSNLGSVLLCLCLSLTGSAHSHGNTTLQLLLLDQWWRIGRHALVHPDLGLLHSVLDLVVCCLRESWEGLPVVVQVIQDKGCWDSLPLVHLVK